jgi:hypothetical protein
MGYGGWRLKAWAWRQQSQSESTAAPGCATHLASSKQLGVRLASSSAPSGRAAGPIGS